MILWHIIVVEVHCVLGIYSDRTWEGVWLNWILSTYFGMGKVGLSFGGLTTWWQRSHQGFQRIVAGTCHDCLPRMYCWGFGSRTTWTLEIPVEGPYCPASSVGADEELCPTSAVNRSVTTVLLGAHIEAAAGYGPVAVYAELLVSWPWDQVWKQILEGVVHIGETWPFNFCQEFF